MDYPKLRPIEAFPVESSGRKMICLRDPHNFTDNVIMVPFNFFFIIQLFDGQHTILDIQAEYMRKYGDLLFKEKILEIVEQLDSHFLLDSERFQQFRKGLEDEFKDSRIRKAAHAGKSYDNDQSKLRKQIEEFFQSPEGPGLPEVVKTGANVKGVIAPHIDLKEGGPCFTWAYKGIAEDSDADLFIIFGTAHSEMKNLFAITKKDFETPLGTVETDREFIEIFERHSHYNLLTDEFVHRSEHTIEFQTVFLRYLFDGEKEIRIVPILCGSFHEMMEGSTRPSEVDQIKDFVAAFKQAVSESQKKICMIASADLAHIGPRYGDQHVPTPGTVREVREEDLEMLQYAMDMDRDGFFSSIQKVRDRRKICGLPPIFTMLSVMNASKGELLKYSTITVDHQNSFVSFAAMVFR